MNLTDRVKFALIGFGGLFSGATEYSFDNIVSKAVSFALESEGFTSVPSDTRAQEALVLKACMTALEPIESIILLMPTRKRIEVGIETENSDVKKMIASLRDSYQKKYDKVSAEADDVNTFVIKSGVESTDPFIIPVPTVFPLVEDEP